MAHLWLAAVLLFAGLCGCGDARTSPQMPVTYAVVSTDSFDELIRSDDLGATWSVRMTSSVGALADVDSPSRDSVWIVVGPMIEHSTDGGLTWQAMRVTPEHENGALQFGVVRFFDSRHGFVGGDEQVPNGPGRYPFSNYPRWLFTTDGGANWADSELPDIGPGGRPCLDGSLTGFVLSGGFGWTTVDGGISWESPEFFEEQGLQATPSTATCAGDSRLWAAGVSYAGDDQPRVPVLFLSDDRGRHWRDDSSAIAQFFPPSLASTQDEKWIPLDMQFSGASGWLLLMEYGEPSPHNVFLRSRDGGQNWERLADPPYPSSAASAGGGLGTGFSLLSFGSETTGALSGARCTLPGGRSCLDPALAITTDGGETFAPVDLSPFSAGSAIRVVSRVTFAF